MNPLPPDQRAAPSDPGMPGHGPPQERTTGPTLSWPGPSAAIRRGLPPTADPPHGTRRFELAGVRRIMARHRTMVVALALALAITFSLLALTPPAGPTVDVLVAARDLPGGIKLAPTDVRAATLPSDAVPAGTVPPRTSTAGWVLAAPVRRGEPLTDVRFAGPGLLRGYDATQGMVAAPVRIADTGAAGLVHSGDVVDILAVGSGHGSFDPDCAAAHANLGLTAGVREPAADVRLAAVNSGRPPPTRSASNVTPFPSARTSAPAAPKPPPTANPSTTTPATPGTSDAAPATRPPTCGARLIVHAARVVLVPHNGDAASPGDDGTGALVVLAVRPADAAALAGAQAAGAVSLVLLSP